MSASAAIAVVGLVFDVGLFQWLGMVGLVLGCLGFIVLLKIDVRKQKLDRLKNPRAWPADASFVPAWAVWTVRTMKLAFLVEAQFMFNTLTGLG
jgi:hypothetical protein